MHTLIEINRFMTIEEVRAIYRLPEPLAGKVLPLLPVAVVQDDGTRLYLESDVDGFLAEFVRNQRQPDGTATPLSGKKGRKDDTSEIAEYVNALRPAKSWKEVFALCQQRWPGNKHVKKREQVRGIWRRHYRKKKRTN